MANETSSYATVASVNPTVPQHANHSVATHLPARGSLLKARAGFLFAWLCFIAIAWVLPAPQGLTPHGKATLAVVAWVAVVWITEAIPVGVSGILLPMLLVLSHAVTPFPKAASGFAAPVVFLCLAALYESWSIPIAVMLAMPLGVLVPEAAMTALPVDADAAERLHHRQAEARAHRRHPFRRLMPMQLKHVERHLSQNRLQRGIVGGDVVALFQEANAVGGRHAGPAPGRRDRGPAR